jgi:hypothetical protein
VVREKVCFCFPFLENDINVGIHVYRECYEIVAEGNWYVDGKEWNLTTVDGHLASLSNECHLNSYQQAPI